MSRDIGLGCLATSHRAPPGIRTQNLRIKSPFSNVRRELCSAVTCGSVGSFVHLVLPDTPCTTESRAGYAPEVCLHIRSVLPTIATEPGRGHRGRGRRDGRRYRSSDRSCTP